VQRDPLRSTCPRGVLADPRHGVGQQGGGRRGRVLAFAVGVAVEPDRGGRDALGLGGGQVVRELGLVARQAGVGDLALHDARHEHLVHGAVADRSEQREGMLRPTPVGGRLRKHRGPDG